MRTLARQCFERDWIQEQSRLNHLGDIVLEKCLYAFELLGRLAEARLNFVFKGGTSLILRLQNLRRISIDIDIVCDEPPAILERKLNICGKDVFLEVVEDHRRHHRPPKRRHWNFYYRPCRPEHCPQPYVILDVLEERNLYPDVEEIPIKAPFIIADHEIPVRVPSIDNLLGDKLTTLAPETIGQCFDEEHPDKIAKHLFDIGQLFDEAGDLHSVRETYLGLYEAENAYRGGRITPQACLDDTISIARLIAELAVNPRISGREVELLRTGIRNLSGHLINSEFNLIDAAVAAGKAALAATIIRYHLSGISLNTLRSDADKLKNIQGEKLTKFPELNKLMAISPEAFYFWLLVEKYSQWD
jgi:hypothetical protein